MWRPRPQTVIFQNQLLFVQKVSIGGRHKRTHTEVQGASWFQFSCHPPLLLFHPRNPPFGLFWLLLLQMNILVRTLMDGPTSSLLSPLLRKQPGVSEFSLQSLHNAQCPGEIPLIQKCRQLIINAAGLPIYRNNTRGSSYASCSSREQRKYLSQFEVCNWYTRVGFIHILLIYTLEILFPAEWQESGRQSK